MPSTRSQAHPPPSRRSFLHALALGTVASLTPGSPGTTRALARLGPAPANAGSEPVAALRVQPSDFAPLSGAFGAVRLGFTALNELGPMRPIVLLKDGTLFRALSAECTHAGCLIPGFTAGKVAACPCHGSRFAADGSVIAGPAEFPLATFAVAPEPDGSVRILLPDFPPVEIAIQRLSNSGPVALTFLALRNVEYEIQSRAPSNPSAPWRNLPFGLTDSGPADRTFLKGTGVPVTVYVPPTETDALLTAAARVRRV